MDYDIRLFRDDDADALCALAVASIREIGVHGYSPVQVEAWAELHPGAAMYRERAARGDLILVVVDGDDAPLAYASLEADGHLDRLYNHPAHTRRGLAGRLLSKLEEHAREAGIKRLYTEASELARPAFERAGYAVTHRRDFEIGHNGRAVPIHNYAMEKWL